MLQLVASSPAQKPSPSPTPTPQAQQPEQKPEDLDVVRITTNLVQVDAVVTDKNGRVVTDLKPDEVELSEDGKVKDISHFQYYSNETTAAAAPETAVSTPAATK